MAYKPKRTPVWGIRKWRGGSWHWRHMRTTAERRLNQHVDSDEPEARGARRPHTLPNAWDDYWRYPRRSWKDHRKHQWKK